LSGNSFSQTRSLSRGATRGTAYNEYSHRWCSSCSHSLYNFVINCAPWALESRARDGARCGGVEDEYKYTPTDELVDVTTKLGLEQLKQICAAGEPARFGAIATQNSIHTMNTAESALCASMPHKPSVKFSILSSAAGSAQIEVSSQSGDCSVTDEFQSTHLRLTRLVNSELVN